MAGAALVGACASPHAPSGRKPPAAAAPAPVAVADADWHALVVVPFGTLLKDVPFPLAEVLMFHDASEAARSPAERDCYALRGAAPPSWFGRPVDEYALCFSSDRLARIEASVSLPAQSAPLQFAAACAQWQHGEPAGSATADGCEGREGATEFHARLGESAVSAAPVVSIVLLEPAVPRE